MQNNDKVYIIRRISDLLGSLGSIIFWLALIFGFEEPSMAFATVIAAIIHEMGHILYLRRVSKSGCLRGALSGFRIKPKQNLSYHEELWLYLSGPLANIIAAFLIWIFSIISGCDAVGYTVANLITALSNLLPIEEYDGYGALRAIIRAYSGNPMAWERLLGAFSFALIFILSIFSLYLIDRFGGGYWIFAIFFASMLKKMSQRLEKD
jgi:Zn-dependent protease